MVYQKSSKSNETRTFAQRRQDGWIFFLDSELQQTLFLCLTLREKCPNTESFLLCKSPYSVRIRENTDQKKLRIWTLFTQRKIWLLEIPPISLII